MAVTPDNLIVALDVGTTKIVCLIAENTSEGLSVRGVGLCAADGVSAGSIRDLDKVERAIRTAVSKAEKMARVTVTEVVVSFSAGHEESTILEAEIDLTGDYVTEADVSRLRGEVDGVIEVPDGRVVLHALPAAYALDGHYDQNPPLGLYGKKLSLSVHVITVEEGPLRNLEMAVRRAQLDVQDVVLASYASALAVMVDDEMSIGSACVDMGAGSTGVTLYALGGLVHTERLAIGADQLTEMIMRNFVTTRDGAEALKVRSGAAICEAGDANQQIDIHRIGETDSEVMEARSSLTSLMQQSYESLLTSLSKCLVASGFDGYMGQRVVLVGGAAQATHLRGLAEKILGRDVRIGEPRDIMGLPENIRSSGFACAVGLLKYKAGHVDNLRPRGRHQDVKAMERGPVGRLFAWLKDSF